MTLRRIFPNTTPVKDYETFRKRAINLYREWLREVRKERNQSINQCLIFINRFQEQFKSIL